MADSETSNSLAKSDRSHFLIASVLPVPACWTSSSLSLFDLRDQTTDLIVAQLTIVDGTQQSWDELSPSHVLNVGRQRLMASRRVEESPPVIRSFDQPEGLCDLPEFLR